MTGKKNVNKFSPKFTFEFKFLHFFNIILINLTFISIL